MATRLDKSKDWVRTLAGLLLAVIALLLSVYVRHMKDYRYVLLTADGEARAFSNASWVHCHLPELSVSANGIKEARVRLHGGQNVTVNSSRGAESLVCRRESVARLLRRLHIRPGAEEMIVLDLTGDDLRISVAEEAYAYHTTETPTDFKTERVGNPLLEKGVEQVAQEGKPGCVTVTWRDTYRNGRLVSTEFLYQAPDSAVPKIIEYGLRVDSVEDTDRIREDHTNEDGSGYLLFESGDAMCYQKKLACTATAYYGGGGTATGYPTGHGVVAVDPRVIPYGTRMWIQSSGGQRVYGMAVARDCGNFRGNMVDVWLPTYNDCRDWGRRNVIVYIFE